jgi:hypothetical protein
MKLPFRFSKLRACPCPRATTIATAVLLAGLVATSTGCMRVNRDAATLRDSVLDSAGTAWNRKFELGVGGLTLGATRLGLSFVELEPEARAALQTVRGADVGIYEVEGRQRRNLTSMLAAADKAMTGRGWERLVGVLKDGQLVAVYLPKGTCSTTNVRVCVAVFQQNQLVIASARTDLEPILEVALNRSEWKEKVSIRL